MKTIKYKNIISIFIGACLILQANSVFAKFLLSPSRVEAKVPPGKSFEEKFEFSNPSDEPVKVKVFWTDRTKNPVVSDWLKISKDIVELAPESSEIITYTVSIPENASGEYNAWFVTQEVSAVTTQGMATFAVRMSVPIYVMVKGTEKYDFDIKKIQINNKKTAEIILNVRNTGNVHIRPVGSIIITGVGSPQKYALKFNEIKWGVIPNQSTDYTTKFKEDKKLADGKYKAKINIHAGDEGNMKQWQKEIVFEVKGINTTIIKGLGN